MEGEGERERVEEEMKMKREGEEKVCVCVCERERDSPLNCRAHSHSCTVRNINYDKWKAIPSQSPSHQRDTIIEFQHEMKNPFVFTPLYWMNIS